MVVKRQIFLSFLFMLVFALAQAAFAQGPTGQISGTVSDQNNAVVAGAAVKLTSVGQAFERTATTNSDGEFAFSLLPPGGYRVEVTANGFAVATAEVAVNVTQTTPVEFRLSVQGATGVVNIELPAVQTETSQNGRVVEGETIRQLPLPSRNFQQILTLSAGAQSGVTNTTDLGRGDAIISVNGQRTTSNSVKINGIDANSIGTNSTPNIAVPATESLQEFVVQTSLYDASSGRNAGGNVEAVTRSGSNQYHGSAYFFLRDKSLNANDPFVKARGLPRPIATRNQFGLTFGGPIMKDRAFIFGSYQGTREVNGVSLSNSLTFPGVPAGLTDTNRTASGLSATFGVPFANISPQALFILNAHLPDGSFAIPSSGVSGLSAGTLVTVPQSGTSRFRENQFSVNGDFNVSNKNSLSAKVFFADNPTKQANYNFAGLGNGNNQLIGFGGDLAIKQTLLSFADTHIFANGIVNQARIGFSRLLVTSVPEEPFTATQLGIVNPLASLYPGAPTITVAGGTPTAGNAANFTFGSSTLADQSSRINAYTVSDTVSWVHGNHRIRIGGEYRQSTVKFYFNAFTRGQLIYTSFNNFLLGSGVSILGSGVFDRSFKIKDIGGFIQDDYKVNERLTLNLGLRYDYYGLPVDTAGRLVNFIPSQFRLGAPPNGLVQAQGGQLAGVPTVEKTLVPSDKNNFAPRIGFAYRLDKAGKLVARGGYGIYYDRISTRYANTQLFNFPYLALGVGLPGLVQPTGSPFVPLPPPSTFPTAATIPSPLSPLAPFVGVAVSGVFVDPDLQTPYIQQYNVGIQWEFLKNTVLEAGYVGNRGTHLLQVVTLNQPVYNPTTNSFAPPLAAGSILSVNKNVTGGMQQIQTTSLSHYDSLQMTLSRRFNRGLQASGAYTWGRSIDYYSGGTINELTNMPGDQSNWRLNKGRSDFNREHRLVISGVYDLPSPVDDNNPAKWLLNDWQVAGIAVFQTGLPFSVVDNPGNAVISRSNFNSGFSGDILTSGNLNTRTGAYFNTLAFAPSCPIGTLLANPSLPPSQRFLCGTGSVGAVNNPFFDPANPFGNTPRNFLTGPGQKNVDLSFIKQFPIRENMRLEFRAEMFNIFNWVNYANPVNNRVLASFGQITSAATGPRVIQFGAKLSF